MTKRALAALVAALLSSSMLVAEGQIPDAVFRACSDEWRAERLEEVPRRDDTHHPLTGKPLSQTPGAKRSREIKRKEPKMLTR